MNDAPIESDTESAEIREDELEELRSDLADWIPAHNEPGAHWSHNHRWCRHRTRYNARETMAKACFLAFETVGVGAGEEISSSSSSVCVGAGATYFLGPSVALRGARLVVAAGMSESEEGCSSCGVGAGARWGCGLIGAGVRVGAGAKAGGD